MLTHSRNCELQNFTNNSQKINRLARIFFPDWYTDDQVQGVIYTTSIYEHLQRASGRLTIAAAASLISIAETATAAAEEENRARKFC